MGNTDNFIVPGKLVEGMSLRLFNHVTGLGSIYWADNYKGGLDTVVVGCFENKAVLFYARDKWQREDIIVKFKWDASNPNKPEWSQAFSADNGKTWEWNWYISFERVNDNTSLPVSSSNKNMKVLELRNYVMKDGMRNRFADFFNEHFICSQAELGGYMLGQYKPKWRRR